MIRDAAEREPPALVATLAPSIGADDPLLVARVAAVHRRLAAAAVPHVLPILAVEHDDGRVKIVHRRIDAQPLAAVLRKGPLPLERTLAILRRACASLGAAQRLGVDHRALGPATLLLGIHNDHELWIADYGIADLLPRDRASAALSLVPITPEQMSGGATATSEDIYLLGCLAYWMIAGAPVFHAEDLATLRRRHAIEDPPRVDVAGVPVALRDAIARALEKDPEDRFPDFATFDRMLARAQREANLADSEPARPVVMTTLASSSAPRPVATRRTLHPLGWTAIGAIVVTAALAPFAMRETAAAPELAPPVVITASVLPEAALPPVPGPVAPVSIAIAAAPLPDDVEIVVDDEAASLVRGRLRDSATDRCEAVRREAADAREAHDWRSLLRATGQRECWRSRRASDKLRIKALLELKEFDACADAVARSNADDPELVRWGEICRRRTLG
ncbi:MAG TPA: hypothetical protein VG755_01850 [Nannocystaceae bacterium]|nr:hypothetical protein [Nannocystaceae bacterium]